MSFIDEIDFYISSGRGGNGAVSFLKKYNKLIPDGGNGGDGGNVYIKGNKNCQTLNKIKAWKTYNAENGYNGQKSKKNGKNGKHLYINVPLGTTIFDNERKNLIGEILKENDVILIAKGGKGGIGNAYFKNNILEIINIGSKTEIKSIHLELYLLADIGLFGYPNSGKSSLINNLTNAKSKVHNYKFTTLKPVLGELKYYNKKIIIADIPGIIQHANKGKGLGIKFLKHLSKTKLLLNIIDITNTINIKKDLIILNKELKKFNKNLYYKEKWLILNKIDLLNFNSINNKILILLKLLNYKKIFLTSQKNYNGIKKLIFNLKEYFLKNQNTL